MEGTLYPSQALIDSGAEDNLIDRSLAEQLGCALNLLDQPIPAYALDGKVFAEVTRCTEPISLVISGNHHKSISFLVIPSLQNPLFLGFPWLKLHNPHIDWSVGKIVGWSAHCHAVCLRSTLSPGEGKVLPPLEESPDLSKIPFLWKRKIRL